MQAEELNDILALAPLLSDAAYLALVPIVNATLAEGQGSKVSYQGSPTNSAWVLGASFKALSGRKNFEWSANVNVRSWTEKVVQDWAWDTWVMSGLVDLLRSL